MASSKKKEDSDYVEFFKDMVKNWKILLPCLFIAGVVGVFVALWIRPVYKVDALLQIETKNNKNMGMMAGLRDSQPGRDGNRAHHEPPDYRRSRREDAPAV